MINVPYMPQAFAHGLIDQSHFGSVINAGQDLNGVIFQQTFIAGPGTTDIVGVDLDLSSNVGISEIIDVTIFESDGTTIVAQELGVVTSVLPVTGIGKAIEHVDFSVPGTLIPGNTYILQVTSSSFGPNAHYDPAGTYTGGSLTIAGSPLSSADAYFATYGTTTAVGSEPLTGSVNVLQNCGLDVSGTLNYGSLIPGLESTPDRTVTLQNTGSVSSDVLVSGSDWLDALVVLQMLVGVTHYTLNGPDLDNYATKTPLTTLLSSLIDVPSGSSVPTYWQIQLLLQNTDFAGLLSQSVTFTFDCLVDFLIYTFEPTNTSVGVVINGGTEVVAEVRDASGAVLDSFTGPVIISIGNDPSGGTATLGGTTTVNAFNGVASFDDLTIDTVGTGYTLIVSAGGLIDLESSPFDIT